MLYVGNIDICVTYSICPEWLVKKKEEETTDMSSSGILNQITFLGSVISNCFGTQELTCASTVFFRGLLIFK